MGPLNARDQSGHRQAGAGRRLMLLKAAAAARGAMTVARVAGRAEAVTGETFILGQSNGAAATTKLAPTRPTITAITDSERAEWDVPGVLHRRAIRRRWLALLVGSPGLEQ